MIDLEVGPPGQQPLEVAEQEVDVQAALVGLVDDQGVVALEHPVVLQLGEQDAVGHHLDAALLRRTVGEPHLVADGLPQLGAELLGDPLGDAAGGDPPRLGVADHRPTGAAGSPRPSARQILGSCVVFPDPVSPATITTWWSRIASAMSSRRAETGRSGGKWMRTAPPFSLPARWHAQPDRRGGRTCRGSARGCRLHRAGHAGRAHLCRCSWRHSRQRSRWRSAVHHAGRAAVSPSRWIPAVPRTEAVRRRRRPRRWPVPRHRARRGSPRPAPPRPQPAATTARSRHPGFGSAAGRVGSALVPGVGIRWQVAHVLMVRPSDRWLVRRTTSLRCVLRAHRGQDAGQRRRQHQQQLVASDPAARPAPSPGRPPR